MNVPTLQTIKLSTISEVCDYLASIINPLYKSNGSSALVVNDIGEMYLTKGGIKVLNEMHCYHPIAKLIIVAIKKYHSQVGDGAKTFLILFRQILTVIIKSAPSEQNATEFRLRTIQQIFSLLNTIPMYFNKLRTVVFDASLYVLENQEYEVQFKQIAYSYFLTKFTKPVADQFTTIICQFITKSIKSCLNLIQYVNYLNNHFPFFTSKTLSVEPSHIIEGFVFSRTLPSPLSLNQECDLIVLENLSDKSNFEDIILEMKTNISVTELITLYSKIYAKFVKSIHKRKISLILMSEMMTEELKYIMQKYNIVFVDGILKEELDFFCSHYNIIPFNIWDIEVSENNIGHANIVKTINLGMNKYLQISATTPAHIPLLHHIVICSPIKSQGSEYFAEIGNCMKLLTLFVSTDLTNISSEDFQMVSKTNKVIGLACPFSIWADNLSVILNPAPQCFISPIYLTISIALKNIVREKFTKSSPESDFLYLEPIIRHEILLCNVLYLLIQLLKLDSIISVQKNIIKN